MVKNKNTNRPGKQRKYHHSKRSKAFQLFDLGERPANVAKLTNMKPSTSYRYFQQWKKLPPLYTTKYRIARKLFLKVSPRHRLMIAAVLASELNSPVEEVVACLQKPWGIRQIVTGAWRRWNVSKSYLPLRLKKRVWFQAFLALRKSHETRLILDMAFHPDIDIDDPLHPRPK